MVVIGLRGARDGDLSLHEKEWMMRARPPHSLSKDVRISLLTSANKGVISTKVRMSANLRKRGLFS